MHNRIAVLVPDLSPDDRKVVASFLYGRREKTERGYLFELKKFFLFLKEAGRLNSISGVSLDDLTDYLNHHLIIRSRNTRARAGAVIKSFFSFCERTGYLKSNPARFLTPIKGGSSLSQRILTREEVFRMIELERNPRNRLIIKMLYVSALRVSELTGLKWDDLRWIDNDRAIEVSVLGREISPGSSGLKDLLLLNFRIGRIIRNKKAHSSFLPEKRGMADLIHPGF